MSNITGLFQRAFAILWMSIWATAFLPAFAHAEGSSDWSLDDKKFQPEPESTPAKTKKNKAGKRSRNKNSGDEKIRSDSTDSSREGLSWNWFFHAGLQLGIIKPSALNTQITYENSNTTGYPSLGEGQMSLGFGYLNAGVGYYFTKLLGASIDFDSFMQDISGSSTGPSGATPISGASLGTLTNTKHIALYAISFKPIFRFYSSQTLNLYVSPSIGFYIYKYGFDNAYSASSSSNTSVLAYATGLGYTGMVGGMYQITENIGVSVDAGYRIASSGDLGVFDSTSTTNAIGTPLQWNAGTARLDFSGPVFFLSFVYVYRHKTSSDY